LPPAAVGAVCSQPRNTICTARQPALKDTVLRQSSAPHSLSRQARQATWSCNAPALHSHCRRRCSSPPSRPCHTNPYSQTRKKPGTASVLSLAPHPCTHNKRALLLRLHSSSSRLMDVRARRGVTARRPLCRRCVEEFSILQAARGGRRLGRGSHDTCAVLQGYMYSTRTPGRLSRLTGDGLARDCLGAQEHPNK
jgi:hypothetical protein